MPHGRRKSLYTPHTITYLSSLAVELPHPQGFGLSAHQRPLVIASPPQRNRQFLLGALLSLAPDSQFLRSNSLLPRKEGGGNTEELT